MAEYLSKAFGASVGVCMKELQAKVSAAGKLEVDGLTEMEGKPSRSRSFPEWQN